MSSIVTARANYNLALPFYENSSRNPQALALFVGGTRYSYGELANFASVSPVGSISKPGEGSGLEWEFLRLELWRRMRECWERSGLARVCSHQT